MKSKRLYTNDYKQQPAGFSSTNHKDSSQTRGQESHFWCPTLNFNLCFNVSTEQLTETNTFMTHPYI